MEEAIMGVLTGFLVVFSMGIATIKFFKNEIHKGLGWLTIAIMVFFFIGGLVATTAIVQLNEAQESFNQFRKFS